MPIYLRHDSIRLFETCLESLHLAISSLGNEKRIQFRETPAKWAVEIGLIGVAAETAMAACLIQAYGPSTIVWPSGQFKTFSAILDDFRNLVVSAPPSSNFLTKDVENPANHRQILRDLTITFRRLAIVRAGGLHAGCGLLWEATVVQANIIADFLQALSQSSRIRPYIESIPRCLLFERERTVVVEDLARRLAETEGAERSQALSSIFLVLPDIPVDEPEWIEALERISIAPRDRDITYLLNILERAVPATMRRTAAGGAGIPVTVRPDDPNALPIAPQHLRRQFNQIQDQWYADIGTSNGRLEQGLLDLPPLEAVRDVLVLGFEATRVLQHGNSFQAQEAWPFIAASLSSQGTAGPYWFLVRRTDDLGQLDAQLQRAANAGSRALERNLLEFQTGINSIRDEQPINIETEYFSDLFNEIIRAEALRENLTDKLERSTGSNREINTDLSEEFRAAQEDTAPVGPMLESILDTELVVPGKTYWARVLAEVACDVDDLPAIVRILAEPGLVGAHTAARKALRRVDFLLHGPPSEFPENNIE